MLSVIKDAGHMLLEKNGAEKGGSRFCASVQILFFVRFVIG